MQTSIRQRVKEVMEFYELNPHSMALKLKTSDTNVRNYITDRDAPHEFLLNIIQTFIEVNPEWLLTGIGAFKREKYQQKFIEQRIDEVEEKMRLVLSKINIEADEPSEADRALRAMKPPKNKEKAR